MLFKIKQIVVFITICLLTSCVQEKTTLKSVTGTEISIDSSLSKNIEIDSFIQPYFNRINSILDSTLAYAPKTLTKSDGSLNTSIGNLMADMILEQSNPIFKSRTGHDVDFVLFNHGGMRSIISKGNISARTAFEVMPFENSISIVELSGKSIIELVNFVIKNSNPHPVSGIQLTIHRNNHIKELKIQGKPFDANRNYFIATSSYLVTGGDNMVFFKNAITVTDIDYSIRNAMIDYFNKKDTIYAEVDNRILKL
ncbi:5'-nucleotidase C-terminal domain-containing protein [Aurantibacter crassamenti]|nr:5'-nucleotidase C-terminal domain-containing protein [Aurantibacter crassamenti]